VRINQTCAKRYLYAHLGVLALLLLFPLYRLLTDRLPSFLIKCFLHDRLFLYCPFCGGTRAVEALLHLDFSEALSANPLAVVSIGAALVLDLVALIRLLRGRERLLPLPRAWWILPLVLAIGYAILRNWFMIAHGYDPLGDLGAFWHQ
jgi:hypothetical protein